MSGEDENATASSFCCMSIIGVGLLIGGCLWLRSLPGYDCLCNSTNCCTWNSSCPNIAPCLCVSVETEAENVTCAPMESRTGGQFQWVVTLIFLGICFTVPIVCGLLYCIYTLIKELLVLPLCRLRRPQWDTMEALLRKFGVFFSRKVTPSENVEQDEAVELQAIQNEIE